MHLYASGQQEATSFSRCAAIGQLTRRLTAADCTHCPAGLWLLNSSLHGNETTARNETIVNDRVQPQLVSDGVALVVSEGVGHQDDQGQGGGVGCGQQHCLQAQLLLQPEVLGHNE